MNSAEARTTMSEKITEGGIIIEKISKLKYEMGRDHALHVIPEDGGPLVDQYNEELALLGERNENTWFTAPWLFAECYLYRLIRSFFALTKYWSTFDPFFSEKLDTFQKSGTAIYRIATTMHEIECEKEHLDTEKIGVLFKEMIQMCLWGNATDLSLLTHLSPSDIENLQTVGRDAQEARKHFILKDDADATWQHLKDLQGDQRVDFVLDNAGFELFTDFVFADFLVTYTPHVSRVVFHPKLIPWFVSDVTPPDFAVTLSSLLDETFFPPAADAAAKALLKSMVTRWKSYVDEGIFSLSVPPSTPLGASDPLGNFWTGPWPHWKLENKASELFASLRTSALVIFKGDLNYRKLTGDLKWPASTAFRTALGPLAGSFPILSLRTNKANVVVGVDQDIADKLDAEGSKWRVSGKYALISFLPASQT